jgi:hypothetical protein
VSAATVGKGQSALPELILGAHLRKRGWNLRYEQSLAGKTPELAALVDRDGQATEI